MGERGKPSDKIATLERLIENKIALTEQYAHCHLEQTELIV